MNARTFLRVRLGRRPASPRPDRRPAAPATSGRRGEAAERGGFVRSVGRAIAAVLPRGGGTAEPARRRAIVVRVLVNALFRALTRRQVFGIEHIPATGPCLLVFNHLSRLDGPLLYMSVPRHDLSALVTEGYRRRPVHRFFIEGVGGVWVRAGSEDHAAAAAALALLERGRIVAVAPEGRISPTEALVEAKPGAAFLAARANVPIVPVAITGTERVVDGLKRLRRTTLTVRFGEPFRLPPLVPGNRKGQVRASTELLMGRLAALLPPEYRGAYADPPAFNPDRCSAAPAGSDGGLVDPSAISGRAGSAARS